MKKRVLKVLIIILLVLIALYKINIIINKQLEKKQIESYIKYSSTYNYYYKPLLVIPKIKLYATIVKANSDYSNLDKSLVYYKSFNPNEKIIVFGHSGAGYGTFFSRLSELNYGDNTYIYYNDTCYKYKVNKVKYIDETNMDILNNDRNNGLLYLITCTKKDKNKRLLIVLRQENSAKAQKISKK